MEFSFSEIINKFQEVLRTPKELIKETFNKPDATDIVKSRYISVKWFGDSYIMVIFETDGNFVRFLNAYRIYPKMMDGVDISRMKPLEILREFMEKYGVTKSLPGFGDCKTFIEKNASIFFFGILDI